MISISTMNFCDRKFSRWLKPWLEPTVSRNWCETLPDTIQSTSQTPKTYYAPLFLAWKANSCGCSDPETLRRNAHPLPLGLEPYLCYENERLHFHISLNAVAIQYITRKVTKQKHDPNLHSWHNFVCHGYNDECAQLDSETCDYHYCCHTSGLAAVISAIALLYSLFQPSVHFGYSNFIHVVPLSSNYPFLDVSKIVTLVSSVTHTWRRTLPWHTGTARNKTSSKSTI